jgi:hypothetical protein
MKCSNCGTKNPKDFKFCKECGEELVVAAPQPAAAPAQPTVVVIKEEKRRRGVPAYIWILVGMILVVLLCGLLFWLDVVDIPETIRVRLPDAIGDLVDAVDDARPPSAPDLPGGVAQDEPEQPWQPPQNPPASQGSQPSEPQQPADEPEEDVCDEPWIDTDRVADVDVQHVAYEGVSYIQFNVPALDSRGSYYRTYIEVFNESGDWVDAHDCINDNVSFCPITELANEPFAWDRGWTTFVFYDAETECELGEATLHFDCDSGEEWYSGWPYNGGCCTVGCYCDDGAGHWGCWQTCAPACAE